MYKQQINRLYLIATLATTGSVHTSGTIDSDVCLVTYISRKQLVDKSLSDFDVEPGDSIFNHNTGMYTYVFDI